MTDWPDDWFRKNPQQGSPGAQGDGATPRTAQVPGGDATVQLPGRPGGPGQPGAGGAGAGWGNGGGTPGWAPPGGNPPRGAGGGWPDQPALRTPGGYNAPPRPGGRPAVGGRWRRWLRPRRIAAVLVVLVSLVLIGSVASYFYIDSQLTKKNVLADYSGRPAPGAGQNWLITGSDSRQGLTRAQERKLHTGHDIGGGRSDTILILHIPSNGGRPVLISLPRDSWVPIPGYGYNKINAAYSFGGPTLLAKTVQNITGLYINHYMGIGFGGFVHVVNAVGGVRLCFKAPINDTASGLHLKAGCHLLDGGQALAYVRARHPFATEDLQRVQDQRIFLRALLRKLTSAGVISDPFKAFPAASGVVSTLTVDSGTSLYQLLKVAFALRNPITTTVPIANANYLAPNGEDAVLWNQAEALKLFGELRNDQPVSKSLITGSQQAS